MKIMDKVRTRLSCAALALLCAFPLLGQSAEREPKTMTDAERMNDKVIARRIYDANARTLLNPKFREALQQYRPGSGAELTPAWGDFVAVDGTTFIALQLALPPGVSVPAGEPLTLFGIVADANGRQIASYNEMTTAQVSSDDLFVERSLVIPLQKASGTFGVARRGEILGMARVAFDPEPLAPAAPGVSRLLVSRDVHILPAAQLPLDPFAFGGTKVVPRPGGAFRRADELWIFAELRNPSLAADGTPHISTKVTLDGPTKVSGPPGPAEATPLKGMPGRYGLGNAIDISKLAAGDYTLRVVITDLVSKQSYPREAAIHIKD